MTTPTERLHALGITLPSVMPPVAAGYVPAFSPFVRSGPTVFVSGRLAKKGDQIWSGKVGSDIDLEEGKAAARGIAIELLAILNHAAGNLNGVVQILRLFVMVNAQPGFTDCHRVADGASELFVEVLGTRGRHARSAVTVTDLPFGSCLEIELIAEIRPVNP